MNEDDLSITDNEFRLIRELVYSEIGIALAPTKKPLVQARLQKRLRHYGLTTYQAYYDLLVGGTGDEDEMTAFINCITTNKTDFFREKHHFDFVREKVVPDLVARAARGKIPKRIRVWHAGCSTGEEPYTLAMVLLDCLPRPSEWDIKLLASDIDTNALTSAEAGIYEAARTTVIPDGMLRANFLRGKGDQAEFVKVRDHLRDLIAFRQINLQERPWPIRPDVRFDMIFCRNVVIYFDRATQQTLFSRFADFVAPGGCLFIGHSETLFNVTDAFVPIGNTVYRLPAARPDDALLMAA